MSDWTQRSATELSRALADRKVSAETLMERFLERIRAVNPGLNAIVSLREPDTLLAEARARDAAWAAGEPRKGWLDGLPIAIKDLANTAGLTTTYGSPIYARQVPAADDLMVARIRAAGAILIGKTNVPEFGLGSQTYNPVFGSTGCAYDTRLTSGGSSGGAAVALAARMLPVADGSDMMGSLRNPSAYNNVYGLRPGIGRIPNLPAQDVFTAGISTTGPMARCAADLAALLATQAGGDARAPFCLQDDPAVLAHVPTGTLQGMHIGWIADWDGYLPIEDGIVDLCEGALRHLEAAGATVENIVPRFDPAQLWSAWMILRHAAVSGRLGPLYQDEATRGQLKPEARWEVESGLGLAASAVHQGQIIRSAWFAELNRLFSQFDALALPSAQAFAFDRNVHWPQEVAGRHMDTYHRWMEVVVPGSLAVGPALGMPAGFDARGRAMGLQLLAAPRAESTLLKIAANYERQAGDVLGRLPAL